MLTCEVFSLFTNVSHPFGNKAISLPGDAANHRVLQRVGMACEPGTVFLVSAWAKAAANPHSVAKKTSIDSDEPFFGIIVRLCYSDGTTDDQYFSFDPLYDGWQHLQSVVASKQEHAGKALSDVIVLLAYDRNYNTALFDNASLRIEPGQTYYYDEKGNLISSAQAGAGSDSADYAENGVDLLEYTAANGNKFNYTYNTQHDVLTATASGIKNTYVYDAAGNVFSSTLTSTNTTENPAYLYTVANASPDKNHTTMVNDSSGGITSYTYNYGYQYMTSSTNADGVTTYYTYYPQNSRPKQTYQSNIAAVTYTYDGGQLSQLDRKTFRGSSPEGLHQYYNFTYNIWGQNTSVKVGTIPLATYAYEDIGSNAAGTGGGLMSQMTYGNGDSVTYTYDAFDRLKKVVYNDTGNYIEYLYTADGALGELHYKKSNGTIINSYAFEYDSLGRLIRSAEYNASGLVQRTEHLYDEHNRLSSQSWVVGSSPFTESYTYNDPDPDAETPTGDGSLLQMTTATGDKINYSYNGLKQLQETSITKAAGGTLYTTDYEYKQKDGNQTPLVEQREVLANGDVVSGLRYSYDALGNIQGIYESELIDGNQYRRPLNIYTYDDQNQLLCETVYTYDKNNTSSSPTTTTVYTYTYDTAGNILTEKKNGVLTKSYTYGNSQWNDLLTAYNGISFGYDGAGNPLSYTNGKALYTLGWAEGRHLISAFVDGADLFDITYSYDADGIRREKNVGSTSHQYVTQNGKVIRETIGSGTTAKVLDFIYDESGRPFALVYTNGTATPVTYYYVLNLQGDVVGLLNDSGTLIAKYSYNAWGEIISVTNSTGAAVTSGTHIANLNPLRYRGYYYDTETGFYYLQSRYYDPVTHRFINADSIASTGQGFVGTNMFAYCLNNPIVLRDSNGQEPVETIDLDGDGEIDCYVYEYSYSGKIPIGMGTSAAIPVSGGGRIYIFVNRTEDYITNPQNRPEGFNPATDYMARYSVEYKDGEENPFIQIADSYRCKYEVQMRAIARAMLNFGSEYRQEWDRTEDSIVKEWIEHNRYALFSDSAKHSDFDNAEEGKGFVYFLWKAIRRVFS